MMYQCDRMIERMEQIRKKLDEVCSIEKNLPDGELLCAKNKKYFKWYLKKQDGISYLPKSKKEFAEKLALKKYYKYQKQELERELAACSAYLHKMQSVEGKAEMLLEHPEYGRLLETHFVSVREELREWQNEPYEKSQIHEENLCIKGTQGKMLRSKSEAIIDMMLYQNRIPFRYEEKLVLDGVTFYPDFVIRHPSTGEKYYWEHFGMMDDEEYIHNACKKLHFYCKNGIIPSINLITTYETKKHPLSVEKVELIIREFLLT